MGLLQEEEWRPSNGWMGGQGNGVVKEGPTIDSPLRVRDAVGMARKLRAECPGAIYHVMNCGACRDEMVPCYLHLPVPSTTPVVRGVPDRPGLPGVCLEEARARCPTASAPDNDELPICGIDPLHTTVFLAVLEARPTVVAHGVRGALKIGGLWRFEIPLMGMKRRWLLVGREGFWAFPILPGKHTMRLLATQRPRPPTHEPFFTSRRPTPGLV